MTMSGHRITAFIVLALCWLCLFAQKQKREDETVTGNASYYSDKLQGHKMSNGERYNRDSFTCAHMRYPLGTLVKVRNPKNGKECIVRVTDRGPHSKKLAIDLSRAAAEYLGIIAAGYSKVEMTPIFDWMPPYALEEPGPYEVPELHIDYEPKATYPYPAWHKASN